MDSAQEGRDERAVRSPWLVGAVALFLVLMVVWVAAAVRISASAAAPSSLMSSLRSRLRPTMRRTLEAARCVPCAYRSFRK